MISSVSTSPLAVEHLDCGKLVRDKNCNTVAVLPVYVVLYSYFVIAVGRGEKRVGYFQLIRTKTNTIAPLSIEYKYEYRLPRN